MMSATLTPGTRQPLTPAQLRLRANYRNLALWTLQGWVAMFFLAAGYAKVSEPMDNLIALMTWPAYASESLARGLGLVEIVLALGLLAPLASWSLGRWPLLISAAGLLGLQTIMLTLHAATLDLGLALTNAILLAMTVPILLGRRSPH
jgi:hypothetical protein